MCNKSYSLCFVRSHRLSYFYNKIIDLHWSMSSQIVINKVTMFLAGFISLLLSVTGFTGKFIIFVYNIC